MHLIVSDQAAFAMTVGVAKAAFFPQIPLTASFGAQSTALTSFLQGPAELQNYVQLYQALGGGW